jgi:hypothetical protein
MEISFSYEPFGSDKVDKVCIDGYNFYMATYNNSTPMFKKEIRRLVDTVEKMTLEARGLPVPEDNYWVGGYTRQD